MKYFFALGYIPHRLWGSVLIPQLLEKDETNMYFVSGEILLKNEDSMSYQRLTPMQKQVVSIIDEYNDKMLHRLFSKKATVKEFQDTIDENTIKEHIRPYIEKRLYEVLRMAGEYRFKVFLKEKTTQNIFPDDFIELTREPFYPKFIFKKGDENTKYRLSVSQTGAAIDLISDNAEVISNRPAAVLIDKRILFIENTEGSKLKPFFSRENVVVQKTSEKKYFSSFIRNTIKEHDEVENIGFEINDVQPEKKAILSLEIGIQQQPVWLITLKYNNYSIHPSSKEKRFVNFFDKKGEFVFERFSRDFEWEEGLQIALEEIGLKSRDGSVYSLTKKLDKDFQYKVYESVKFTNDHFDVLAGEGFHVQHKLDKNYMLQNVKLEYTSREREDWFDLEAEIHFGEHKVKFIQLRDYILSGNRLFPLPDGQYAVIPEEWFSRYKAAFEFGTIEGGTLKIHKQHFSQVDEAIKRQHAETIKNLEKLTNLSELPHLESPSGLNARLREYQLEGFAWMWLLQENGFGGCLADDMGLGKTLQAIAVLQRHKEIHVGQTNLETPEAGQLALFEGSAESHTSLVIVPATLIQNWINEITRFAPSLKTLSHAGISRKKSASKFKYADVIISSYHTIRQDIEFIREFPFNYVILDESQVIKNPHSKVYRAMIELQARHRLVLTGTPIENSLTDLWSQINFVNEGLLGSLSFFKKQFVNNIEKKKNKEQEDRLKQLINPFILRRTKEEVAKELPPLYEHHRFCNMTDEQRRVYEEEKSTVRNSLLENIEEIGMERSALMVLKALTRLRQISNHPAMVEDEYDGGSGKYDEVFRNIESVVSKGHKVLIFSSFVKHLKLYAERLESLDWKFAMLTGSTRDRAGQVDFFQDDPDCKIFLISLKAGGVGLNLTAADYVFILDPWWNPAAEMQALNRAHRIGQDKRVFVYRFISNHTVEEKIQRLQERKSELARTFVASNNPLRNMKQEEILELFS